MTRSDILSSRLWAAFALLVYTLGHLLAVVSLIHFGIVAGGYPLNRWGIYIYAGAVAVALGLTLRIFPRRDNHPDALLLALPPLLALWVTSLYFTTATLGAEYAPYLDDDGIFAALNLAYALGGCLLALLYRWPGLLVAWAAGQGILLLTNPALWVQTIRYGIGAERQGALVLITPAYALTALALRYRPSWRRLLRWLWPFALIGLAIAVRTTLAVQAYRHEESAELTLILAYAILTSFLTGVFTVGLPFYAWWAGKTWPEDGMARRPNRWVWVAFLTLLFLMAGASASGLSPQPYDAALPVPGTVQGWRSSDHVVPDAYGPFITWAGWLFRATRWLLIPVALLALGEGWRERKTLRFGIGFLEFPRLLLWPGLASLLIFAALFHSPPLGRLAFVLYAVWDGRTGMFWALAPLVAGVGLVWVYRIWEQSWGTRARTAWAMLTAALLLLFIAWQVDALLSYGRVLFAPLPAWETRWEHAPFDPALMSVIGLVFHAGLAALGSWTLWRCMRIWRGIETAFYLPARMLRKGVLITLAVALPLFGLWWWWTDPGIIETVPPQGATNVPRDTMIRVTFHPSRGLGGWGQGTRIRYADTGDYIPGATAGWRSGMSYDPEGLLRPNAVVEFTVHQRGRRPYTLRFTTAGVDGPTATPMPHHLPETEVPAPVPTALPTVTGPVSIEAVGAAGLVDCAGGEDTAEACLADGSLQLVGYLAPAPEGDEYAFVLHRAGDRRSVRLVLPPDDHQRDHLDWLQEHHYLTLVRGRLVGQDPPTLEVTWHQGAAKSFLVRSTPLAKLLTLPELGLALEMPANWIVERPLEKVVFIQNFHSADRPTHIADDPSLYQVVITLLPPEFSFENLPVRTELIAAREEIEINGLAALRLTLQIEGGERYTMVFITHGGQIIQFATPPHQNQALFERMVETVRALER